MLVIDWVVVGVLVVIPIVLLLFGHLRRSFGIWLFILWLAVLAGWLVWSNPHIVTCVRNGLTGC